MTILRFSAPVLLATLLLVPGCKKKDTAPAADPAGSGSAASAAPATPPPAPPAAATPPPSAPPAAAGAGSGGVVPSATLEAIDIPKPKGAPDKGMWSSATAGGDGDRWVNYMVGDDLWASLRFVDCNMPAVKEVASKPPSEQSDFKYCFEQPTGKLKDYPLYAPHSKRRVVKVGHLTVIADIGLNGEGKMTPADLEAFLESLDLPALAKL